MIGSTIRQSSLFYVPLASQISLLKDDLLEPVGSLLDDPELVDMVRKRLAARRSNSTRTGRHGIAPDRLLRCCVLKHLKGWSFRELERELRANLVCRRFTRFDADPTPDFTTLCRTFALLGPSLTQEIQRRVVAVARQKRVASGRKVRSDTTVVESNVHYPTDSTLLADGIRVLTRSLKRIAKECEPGAVAVVTHARSVKHRLLEISRAAKSWTEANQERLKGSYRKLVGLTRRVIRQGTAVLEDLQAGTIPVVGDLVTVLANESQLRHFMPLVQRVIAQTEERILRGNRHVTDKVLSLFEPHTRAIRKGKAHKPTEFGRLVRIDEVRLDRQGLAVLEQHEAYFSRPPDMATGDRGYYSARNEREAKARGVKRVALPARGRLSKARAKLQKERWFRRALRWRAGIEATISTLKHPFSMARATYKGDYGFQRYVGWCVITKNLVSIARALVRRKGQCPRS